MSFCPEIHPVIMFLEAYPQWHERIPQKYIASYLGNTGGNET